MHKLNITQNVLQTLFTKCVLHNNEKYSANDNRR